MNYLRNILFALLEITIGLLLGTGSLKLLMERLDNGDLNQSIIRAILCFLSFGFIGIISVGLLQVRLLKGINNFITGILGCIFGLILGSLFAANLPNSPIVLFTPIFCGTAGFNIGLTASFYTPYNRD